MNTCADLSRLSVQMFQKRSFFNNRTFQNSVEFICPHYQDFGVFKMLLWISEYRLCSEMGNCCSIIRKNRPPPPNRAGNRHLREEQELAENLANGKFWRYLSILGREESSGQGSLPVAVRFSHLLGKRILDAVFAKREDRSEGQTRGIS